MPEQGIQMKRHEDILRFEEILKIVKAASSIGINKVRYTGGEPLVMKNIDKLIYETSRISGIEDIAITTNGILLPEMAEDLKKAGLKRVNISLDTLDKEKFKSITRNGQLDKVIEGIHKCLALGIEPVKINTVLMKGINDDEIRGFLELSRELPIEIRFIELMPIGEGAKLYEKSKISFKDIIFEYPELIKIEQEKSSTAQLYRLEGAKGKVGFISPISCKFCSDCNKIRLTSTGKLKQCLHSKEELNLKEYLQDEEQLLEVLRSAIFNKPLEHHLEEEKLSRNSKSMYEIGG
jgi:cyclic pyranopterin phosphate synthase